ncbi:TRAF-like protein [Corchorus olitorius]|uniref:TRAF-like protein n=1 Tax=Corchorus olitorius TaxID=93759 RepID=A0A1R3GZK3_9ROSI|nr:TRAF-like protein [Corchorus olitorius]
MIDGKLHRFHETKRLCEYDFNSYSIDALNNPSSGYLKNDCCVVGVEVFVVKNQGKGETSSMKKEPHLSTALTWKIDKFSELTEEDCCSDEVLSYGGYEWKLTLFPKGIRDELEGKSPQVLCSRARLGYE